MKRLILSGLVAATALTTFSVHSQSTATKVNLSAVDQCVAHFASPARRRTSPFFGDPNVIKATCECATKRVAHDATLAALLASITPESSPANSSPAFLSLSSTVLACAADAMRDTPNEISTSGAAYVRSMTNALLSDDRRPRYKPAAAIDAKACMPNEYPDPARRAGAEGTTVVAYLVNTRGKQSDVDIVKTSGNTPAHKLLDFHAALSGTRCEFTPAEENGKVVEGWSRIEVVWQLTN